MGRTKAGKPAKPTESASTGSGLIPGIDPRIMKMTPEEIEAFIQVAQTALDPHYGRIAVGMASTFMLLAAELKAKRVSIARLTALLFGDSSEKTAKVCPPKVEKEKLAAPKKKPGHGRNGAAAFPGAAKVKVPHEAMAAGDECPECPNGRVYPMAQPAVLVRIVGMSPLQATVTELERLRCNACGEVFKAQAPEDTDPRKFDETASAMVGLLKYGTGAPFHRIARLQKNLGIPLPASTQWDLVLKAAWSLDPVMDELARLAAQAELIHNDDTTMKLLDRPDLAKDPKARKGVYTTGLVARVVASGERRAVVLFRTGNQHAGENLADVLKQRNEELPVPIQMCDALAANTKGDFETLVAHCLAHARRRFVDVIEDFPDECRHLLEALREVYRSEHETKAMSPPERLAHHQKRSGPVMAGLKDWLQDQLHSRRTEPNSGLGKAIDYMLKHWTELTLFLREPGAPLDNNICERALKRAILHRKNSLFYKTINGARVGDTFMSLIHTAELNDANPFDYLVELQKNHALVEENPAEWMPWNYRQTLAGLKP